MTSARQGRQAIAASVPSEGAIRVDHSDIPCTRSWVLPSIPHIPNMPHRRKKGTKIATEHVRFRNIMEYNP